MSADKLVFDLSQEIEGQPQIFIKKDWLNILDNMNQNYSANQSLIDTSQLSNSNKWMNYREAYLSVPLLLTLTGDGYTAPAVGNAGVPLGMSPTTELGGAGVYAMGTACDYVMGLRNWFGTIIHSFTLDMNGTTIIQQTPLINMINSFRLLTSLSWNDILTQGSTIGFYPDSPNTFSVNGVNIVPAVQSGAPEGQGVCNNSIAVVLPSTANYPNDAFARYDINDGNVGLSKRIQYINLDPDAVVGINTSAVSTTRYGNLMTGYVNGSSASTSYNQLWLSYVSKKQTGGAGVANSSALQISVCATIYLKHIHNFFSMVPLLKGTFFKMTAFLNNSSTNFTVNGRVSNTTGGATRPACLSVQSVNVPVGGVNPLMITSAQAITGGSYGLGNGSYIASISVGNRCLNQTQLTNAGVGQGVLSPSIYLYVPAYTFNPVFESAYLSSPVKSIKYSDYYQYQVQNITAGSSFNNLLTNGISNLKSITILPYYSTSNAGGALASGLPTGLPVWQSPFDTAGSTTTSPYCLFTNFNVVVSGQNTIYNTQFRMQEQFNNNQKGANSVNGDMTDGLTSGLLNSLGFQSSQCYFYVNVSRQLPVEEQVPKSVQIIGQNLSSFAVDLFCFLEYGVAVDVDSLTGARV
jgi:hypothetical protein